MRDKHSRCGWLGDCGSPIDESKDSLAAGHPAFDLFEDTGQFSDRVECACEQGVECGQFRDTHGFGCKLYAEDCVGFAEHQIGSGGQCCEDSQHSHGFRDGS